VGIVGLLFADFFEEIFSSPTAAAGFLLVTAVLLVVGERMLSGKKALAQMTWRDAVVVGLFQMVALLPGVSRSGSTIVGGLSRGLDRPTAARFSFLLGIPAILAAGLQAILEIFSANGRDFSTGVYVASFPGSSYHRLRLHPLAANLDQKAHAVRLCRLCGPV
jgi:undecaprenyl-diphosphatase